MCYGFSFGNPFLDWYALSTLSSLVWLGCRLLVSCRASTILIFIRFSWLGVNVEDSFAIKFSNLSVILESYCFWWVRHPCLNAELLLVHCLFKLIEDLQLQVLGILDPTQHFCLLFLQVPNVALVLQTFQFCLWYLLRDIMFTHFHSGFLISRKLCLSSLDLFSDFMCSLYLIWEMLYFLFMYRFCINLLELFNLCCLLLLQLKCCKCHLFESFLMHGLDEYVIIGMLYRLLFFLFLRNQLINVVLFVPLPNNCDFIRTCPCLFDFLHNPFFLFNKEINSVLNLDFIVLQIIKAA